MPPSALSYHVGLVKTVIHEPTEQQIIECINLLNNDDRSGSMVNVDGRLLIVTGGNEDGHVMVNRVSRSAKTAVMIDPDLRDDPRIIDMEIMYQATETPIGDTVTKAMAIQAALHLLHTGKLDPSLTWLEMPGKRVIHGEEKE